MKVVSGPKKSGNQVEIIKPTANFHENADFPLIGLALSGNGRKTRKGLTILIMTMPNSFLFVFYVLITFKATKEQDSN